MGGDAYSSVFSSGASEPFPFDGAGGVFAGWVSGDAPINVGSGSSRGGVFENGAA